ncbi:CBU_0592 family membrane protein [Nocardia anaemiae]|uniref:CBU_0592 family membrane protein n=1 Tax=Nocardia anaemiae TaxID=263910 RepID=UPI0007C80767|nr:hypothetical protein [Nocardia anaemiae]
MSQILQVAGALLLLAGFVSAQIGGMTDKSVEYLVLNAVGGALLAVLAFMGRDWGFLLLEGTWAVVSAISLRSACGSARSVALDPAPVGLSSARTRRRYRQLPTPPIRAAVLRGDELCKPERLIHLFRNSYAGSQGRQWLQAHILWWTLAFLRDNGVRADIDLLTSPELSRRIVAMALPPGHPQVHPVGQPEMNFGLWWSILADIARVVYRPRWRRVLFGRGPALPDLAELERRTWQLGLRPWMSSTGFEELAGIARALSIIGECEGVRPVGADKVMTQVLLPELLVAELHWLRAPGGRLRTRNRPRVDVVLLRRYSTARVRWADGRYLNPLDHMYLRAGDLLDHHAQLPQEPPNPALRHVLDMYREICRADNDMPDPDYPDDPPDRQQQVSATSPGSVSTNRT